MQTGQDPKSLKSGDLVRQASQSQIIIFILKMERDLQVLEQKSSKQDLVYKGWPEAELRKRHFAEEKYL